jgi:biotin carboxylase
LKPENRRLLIIGAGEEQWPAYRLALDMGLKVVGSDMNPEAPAFSLPVDRIVASTYDPDETVTEVLAYHQVHPIDGVMTLACDAPLTVARVARVLGLPGISEESAVLGTDKYAQIQKFHQDGLPVPEFALVETVQQAEILAKKWGYPVITKPVVGRGGRGVLRVTDPCTLGQAFDEVESVGGQKKILIQKYLHGPQISSETIVVEGVAHTAMFSGRNYEHLERFAPHIIENGGWLPALLTSAEEAELTEVIQRVADSYGITDGFIKGDLVMTPEGVKIIEFAARMGGGYAVSHSIPAVHGVNLVEQAIRLALGWTIDTTQLVPRYRQSAAIRFFLPEPGVVKEIRGFDQLDEMDGLILKKMYTAVGEIIGEMTNHTRRAGCVIMSGKDHAEAEQRVLEAISRVQIITEPI